ncbi:transposase [Sphingobium sp. CCH11-B1]|uniref:transposase n=1 Tax=Sphingobium sp. CCH11-B1 TaxID=1768781 RepID=UPI00083777A4|nr:transposase [Sphingobium sp. CCH11-B1]MEA3387875.1 transposase [Pseudomonadota bacterium]
MPRLITPVEDDTIVDLDALVDWCESSAFDPGSEEGLATAAPMLDALSRNRHFLADFALAELKTRCAGQRRVNPYSAQVILLSPPTNKYVLRAAFWPAERDHVVRMQGASAFLYHVPHDHGFDFLTVGHIGPGYVSDYYDYDVASIGGADGEAVALRFIERSALSEGKILLYRANRDIHAQRPPNSLSVSLNILASAPDQGWRRQYRFDTERGLIAQGMTVASAQMLLELGVGCGMDNALDLAHEFAAAHPQDAMRLTAWRAIGTGLQTTEGRIAHLERGARHASRLIRTESEIILRKVHCGGDVACF